MHTEFTALALVLLAAVLHAAWNAVVKLSGDRLLTMAAVIGVGSLLAMPALFVLPLPAPASRGFLALSVLLHLGYFYCLIEAYRTGDLSHVYPVARGAAPVLVGIGAATVAGESLRTGEIVGLLAVCVSISGLAFEPGRKLPTAPRALLFALATAACIGAYTLSDGLGVRRAGDPLSFIAWLFVIDGIPLTALALLTRRADIGPFLAGNWRPALGGGVLCALAYGLVIWALGRVPMAQVSALRETGVVFAVLIGTRMLGEPFGRRRIGAAFGVATGIAIMHLAP